MAFNRTSRSPGASPPAAPSPAGVIQATFPGGRLPVKFALQRGTRGGSPLPPHPATLARSQRSPTPYPHSAQRAAAPRPSLQPHGNVHAFAVPEGLLAHSKGPSGRPLPPLVQKKMETFFSADFSDVRIHVGPEAHQIGAIAFTLGSDIYFAPGQYEPHTPRGQQLLGHELTHVLQQREGRVPNPLGQGVAVVQDHELEAEADRMGEAVAAQRSVAPAAPRTPALKSKASHRLVIGAYLHENAERLPDPLAGHTFVALESPGQPARAWGFSPANFGGYNPQRDLGRLRSGVAGVVHDDAAALGKPGVRTRAYPISETQAQAALAKIAEYQSGRYQFSLDRRQCSTFALDVLRAAQVADLPGTPVRKPRDLYRQLV